MTNPFTKEYFTSNNYRNYLSKNERYLRTAEEVFTNFKKFGMLNTDSKILDYGCGVGFLIRGFHALGFGNIYGYDISEWAIEQANQFGCKTLLDPSGVYDLGIFLDVLEHMTDSQIQKLFDQTSMRYVLVRIPCAIESNPTEFHLEVSKNDPTHVNCKTADQWINFFSQLGYSRNFRINFSTIYDSDGCFCAVFLK